jgi:hypothetical protein
LPPVPPRPDGSYRSVLVWPGATPKQRRELIEAARRGDDLDPDRARPVRVIEYDVPDREGDGKHELIALVTTITDRRRAPAAVLAAAYHERWERGYLLTHYAISALICTAATSAGTGPDQVKFKRAVRVIRRRVADPAFPP